MQLPGYEIIQKIGEGGMAVVWKARQVSLDRVVALKVLSKEALQDREAFEQFKHEAQAAARLNHPGIVQIYDAGEHEGVAYFVMEFVDGPSLGTLLDQRGSLRIDQALGIVEGVVLSMQYAWDKARLIHCDIKPDNVLLDREGTVKVSDLGVSRIIGHAVDSLKDHIVGTPNYISPEQVTGEVELDARTDIYSLGAMLYQMVTGVMPFSEYTDLEAMEKHRTGYLADPVDVNADVPAEVAWLIERMMVKHRDDRFSGWKDMREALQAVRKGFITPMPTLEEGRSTILQNADRVEKNRAARTPSAGERKGSMRSPSSPAVSGSARGAAAGQKPSMKVSSEKGARKQLVLGQETQAALSRPRSAGRKKPSSLVAAFRTLLLLAVIAGLLYGGWFGWTHYNQHQADQKDQTEARAPRPDELPPRTRVRGQDPDPQRSAQTRRDSGGRLSDKTLVVSAADLRGESAPDTDTASSRPSTSSGSSTASGSWDNDTYQEGMRLLRRADREYQRFVNGELGQDDLDGIEQGARKALDAFEACVGKAPQGINVRRMMNKCYLLISKVRHSRTLDL